MKTIATIILFSLIISACTTQPYVRYKTPNITGTLFIDGSPAKGTAIYLSLDASDTACKKFIKSTHTDESGGFLLPAEKIHMDYTPLMTHYLDEWVICADIKGINHEIYSNNRYGIGSVPHNLTLDCRIDSQANIKNPCQHPMHE